MESEKQIVQQETIEELMDLIRCNDSESFEDLYAMMRDLVLHQYGKSLRSILPRREWECEARGILHKAIDQYRSDRPAGFRTFYARSLQYAAIDRIRHTSLDHSRRAWIPDEYDRPDMEERRLYQNQKALRVCESDPSRELEEVLSIIKKDLSLRDLKILRLLGQGFRKNEAAKICSVSPKTVRAAINRARLAWKKSGQNGRHWLQSLEQN